ncbi:membrane protein [Stenotrophomonas ginsengisoli]|uniref:Membrane protein n=1 Tax=Stenotrophomonas ginsengisoli TaxID=336566 RepID=A0A0R0DE58_9GAMM|nr:DnaJ domain-containing protein [Stenotrophomonas ginsengisoli]KRG76586.1 membrane protein [Stenotrophomonas ginsengisoli]
MRWYGKLLGAVAGALLFRPNPLFGGLIGLLLGHAFDANWFGVGRNAPYRVLGVDPAASDAEIDTAYRRLISQYHPDKVAGAAPELRAAAEHKASEINAAYDRIKQLRKPR